MAPQRNNANNRNQQLPPGAAPETMEETVKVETPVDTSKSAAEHVTETAEAVQAVVDLEKPNWFVRAWRRITGFFKRGAQRVADAVVTGARKTWSFLKRTGVTAFTLAARGGKWLVTRIGMFVVSLGAGAWTVILAIVFLPVSVFRTVVAYNRRSAYEGVGERVAEARENLSRRQRKLQAQAEQRQAEAAARKARGAAQKAANAAREAELAAV